MEAGFSPPHIDVELPIPCSSGCLEQSNLVSLLSGPGCAESFSLMRISQIPQQHSCLSTVIKLEPRVLELITKLSKEFILSPLRNCFANTDYNSCYHRNTCNSFGDKQVHSVPRFWSYFQRLHIHCEQSSLQGTLALYTLVIQPQRSPITNQASFHNHAPTFL